MPTAVATKTATLESLRSGGIRSILDRLIADRGLTPTQASFLRSVSAGHVEQPLASFFDAEVAAPNRDIHDRLVDQVVVSRAYADAVAEAASLIEANI